MIHRKPTDAERLLSWGRLLWALAILAAVYAMIWAPQWRVDEPEAPTAHEAEDVAPNVAQAPVEKPQWDRGVTFTVGDVMIWSDPEHRLVAPIGMDPVEEGQAIPRCVPSSGAYVQIVEVRGDSLLLEIEDLNPTPWNCPSGVRFWIWMRQQTPTYDY